MDEHGESLMEHASQAEVTRLVEALAGGDSTALDGLFPPRP